MTGLRLRRATLVLLFSIAMLFPLFASEEDALFGDGSFTDANSGDALFSDATETTLPLNDLLLSNKEGITLGGSYSFIVTPSLSKNLDSGVSTNLLITKMNTTLYFDARPDTAIRVYGKAYVSYLQGASNNSLTITLRELFSDFAIKDAIFFRVGKQVINWGVGYFFSPADLLNVVKIDVLDPTADREGTIAIKANAPLGVNNLYGYIVLPQDGTDLSDLAWAAKYEQVVGQTEIGFGGFYKDGEDPAAMVTISSAIRKVSLFGEAVAKYGSDALYFEGTVGAQFSWSSDTSDLGVSFTGQYYYNGKPSAVSTDMSQYAATSLGMTFTDTLSAGLFWYGNLSDFSGMVKPTVTWKPTDYISLAFGLDYYYGGTGTQFTKPFAGQTLAASVAVSLGGTSF